MTRRPTVLLADDHAVFTDGLTRLLTCEFDVLAAVRDGKALIMRTLNVHSTAALVRYAIEHRLVPMDARPANPTV